MAITKDFLENLGVTGEAASAIFAERGKEITETNAKIAELTSQNAALNESITNLTSEKENLSKLAGDADAYKKQLETYQAEAAERDKKAKEEAADKDLTSKIEALFADKQFTSDYARAGLISDIKKKFGESGNTLGLSEICDSLTKDKTGIFESKHKKTTIPSTGSGQSDSADEMMRIRQLMGLPTNKG